jgi:signal transduction histidine kinase
VTEQRARLVAVTDAERRALERALHDGVQQDLIAISVRLQLARRLAGTELEAALDEIRHEVRETLDRVRAIASDVYPSLLDARGLRDALAATRVDASGLGRYPAEVEAALFFCCKAVLDQSATGAIRISEEGDVLRLDVDGTEIDATADAFVPVRERIEVLGGTLSFRPDGLVAVVPRT